MHILCKKHCFAELMLSALQNSGVSALITWSLYSDPGQNCKIVVSTLQRFGLAGSTFYLLIIVTIVNKYSIHALECKEDQQK